MSSNEQILASAQNAAVTTLGEFSEDARETKHVSLAVVDAILSTRVVSVLLECDSVTRETLPWPEIPRQFQMQVEVLWRHYQNGNADRQAIAGALDRIAAELYELTIDDLMKLQRLYANR